MTTTTSGRAARDLVPAELARALAGRGERVDAAGGRDHLRHPVAAAVGRVEPLERGDPGAARRPAVAARTASIRALEVAPQPASRRRARRPPRRASRRRRAPRRASTGRARGPRAGSAAAAATARTSSLETAQTAQTCWVTIRSDVELRQARRVERVERLAGADALADGGVDLGRRRGRPGSCCGSAAAARRPRPGGRTRG